MSSTVRMSDLAVFHGLAVVTLDGFEPEKTWVTIDGFRQPADSAGIDLPGSANWLVSEYGLQPDEFDPETRGILWTDYDGPGWRFSVLVASDEVGELTKLATDAGYCLAGTEEIAEPCTYGDGHAGTVTVMKHPDGWVVVN